MAMSDLQELGIQPQEPLNKEAHAQWISGLVTRLRAAGVDAGARKPWPSGWPYDEGDWWFIGMTDDRLEVFILGLPVAHGQPGGDVEFCALGCDGIDSLPDVQGYANRAQIELLVDRLCQRT